MTLQEMMKRLLEMFGMRLLLRIILLLSLFVLTLMIRKQRCSCCVYLCCSKSGDRITRHNRLRNLVFKFADTGLVSPELEKLGILGATDTSRRRCLHQELEPLSWARYRCCCDSFSCLSSEFKQIFVLLPREGFVTQFTAALWRD